MRGTKRSKEAQDRATGKGQGGKGPWRALALTFLLALPLIPLPLIPALLLSFLQHHLGCLLAQYVIWLGPRDFCVGFDVFGSLIPAAAAALLAIAMRTRGLSVFLPLPFAARGVSVARLLAYAAALPAIGALLPLAWLSAARLAAKSSVIIAALLALGLVSAIPVTVVIVILVMIVKQVMRPEKAGPWLAAEAYVTALALSLLADTFAVVLSYVTKFMGLLQRSIHPLVYGGCGLTDGLVVTPVGVAMATLAAVGIFKLLARRMQTSGPSGLS